MEVVGGKAEAGHSQHGQKRGQDKFNAMHPRTPCHEK
jgi:hypothetical protein